jgi:TolB protein
MARPRLYLPTPLIAAAVLVACAVASLLAVSAEKAGAAFPGANGRTAYQGSDDVIYTIDPINTTGGRTKVAKGEQPSYSSDGTKITFAASDKNDAEIYTINTDGTGKFQVTHNDVDDLHPTYSPDGRRIAYTCSDGHDSEICTISATGGKPFRITRNAMPDFGPSWSPGGKRIAYSGVSRSDWEVYTIGARGGGRFNVTKNDTYDYYPDYSPDGKKIAYAAKRTRADDTEIRTIRATGGRSFQLTDNRREDIAPSYSPDGKKIAYTHYSDPGRPAEAAAIYKIVASGGRGVLVTANGGTGALYPSWGNRP